MPVSSTDVNNIIQAQLASFSNAAQYARSLSGGPTPPNPLLFDSTTAGIIGSAAARAPDVGVSAISGAAMLGLGPRLFDPFSGSLAAASMGYGAQGLAGGIGMGLGAFGAYTAAGSALGWATDQMATGAQMRGVSNTMVGAAMPGATAAQMNQMSGTMESLARAGQGSMGELTALMGQGIGSGSLDMSNMSRFQTSFTTLVSRVREVATVLNSSLTEAHAAIESVRGLGISQAGAPGVVNLMRGIGGAAGLDPSQAATAIASGAGFGRMAGIDPDKAAIGALTSTGVYSLANKAGVPGVADHSYGTFSQGAMRFLSSGPGSRVLGALMNPYGGIDAEAADQLTAGTMSLGDVNKRYNKLISQPGGRDLLSAHGNEAAASFITEYGPQALSPAMRAMAAKSSRPETFLRSHTGMTGADLDAMSNMNTAGPMLQQQLIAAASEGMNSGGYGSGGMSGAITRAMDVLTKPMRDKLREYGASLTGAVETAVSEATHQFIASPPTRANPRAYADYFKASLSGESAITRGLASASGYEAGFDQQGSMARGLPAILSMEKYGEGAGAWDLPMAGLATSEYNPYLTGGAVLANTGLIGKAGRSMMGWGMSRVGGLGGVAKGLMSDFSLMQGLSRSAGAGAVGLGGATALLGGAAKLAGPALLGLDIGMNVGPEFARRAGWLENAANGIGGTNADMLMDFERTAAVNPNNADFQALLGRYSYDDRPEGAMPVLGTMNNADNKQLYFHDSEDNRRRIGDLLQRAPADSPLGKYKGSFKGVDRGKSAEDVLKGTITALEEDASKSGTTAEARKGLRALKGLLSSQGVGGSRQVRLITERLLSKGLSMDTPEGRKAFATDIKPFLSAGESEAVEAALTTDPMKTLGLISSSSYTADRKGIDQELAKFRTALAKSGSGEDELNAMGASQLGVTGLGQYARQYYDSMIRDPSSDGSGGTPTEARAGLIDALDRDHVGADARAIMAGQLARSGNPALQDLGRTMGVSAHMTQAIKDGTTSGKLLSGLFGKKVNLSQGDRDYLQGKSNILSLALEDQLVGHTIEFMTATLGSAPSPGDARANAAALIQATRDKAMGKGDSALVEVAKNLATMPMPVAPGNPAKTVTDSASALVTSMKKLTEDFDSLHESISKFTR